MHFSNILWDAAALLGPEGSADCSLVEMTRDSLPAATVEEEVEEDDDAGGAIDGSDTATATVAVVGGKAIPMKHRKSALASVAHLRAA